MAEPAGLLVLCEDCQSGVALARPLHPPPDEGAAVYVRLDHVVVTCPNCSKEIHVRDGVYELTADHVIFVRDVSLNSQSLT